MKELKSTDEIQEYIRDLERKINSLQNTHAYRVGLAIMKYYDQPVGFNKILGIKKFISDIIEGTRKVKHIEHYSDIKITLPVHKTGVSTVAKTVYVSSLPPSEYYYVPHLKSKKIVLSINSNVANDSHQYFFLTPNNYRNFISFLNADVLQLNLDDLLKEACWRGFGTYDDIQRTNEFLNLLKQNQKMKKVLIHSNNLRLFPLFLDQIDLFDKVIVMGENNEI
ncbi:hypothetical protein [Acinetobacter sp. F9]|uniref:hypothetical protein n=1 Tax=Acinetobacter sp. F9 TaxID=2853158 RepID=UPI001C457419|nr:hypothetical protein [Acinetobacter sp. F9]